MALLDEAKFFKTTEFANTNKNRNLFGKILFCFSNLNLRESLTNEQMNKFSVMDKIINSNMKELFFEMVLPSKSNKSKNDMMQSIREVVINIEKKNI